MTYQPQYDDDAPPLTHEQEAAAWAAQLEGRPVPGQRIVKVKPKPDPSPENIEFHPMRWRRFDGWTAERQRIFIRTLAETACVSEACEAAGCSPRSAYRLRLRPGAESFAAAWAQALVLGAHRLTGLAFERAIHGTRRAVFAGGKQIADELVPNDKLLMFLLRHFDRTRYGNLSGFLQHEVADPAAEARAALPGLLDGLADVAPPADADWDPYDAMEPPPAPLPE